MSLPPNLPAGAGAATAPFNPAKLTADVHAIDADAVALATRLNAGTSGFAANSVPGAGQLGHFQWGSQSGVLVAASTVTNLATLPVLSAGTYLIDAQLRIEHSTSTASTARSVEITTSGSAAFAYKQSFKNHTYSIAGIQFMKTSLIAQVLHHVLHRGQQRDRKRQLERRAHRLGPETRGP